MPITESQLPSFSQLCKEHRWKPMDFFSSQSGCQDDCNDTRAGYSLLPPGHLFLALLGFVVRDALPHCLDRFSTTSQVASTEQPVSCLQSDETACKLRSAFAKFITACSKLMRAASPCWEKLSGLASGLSAVGLQLQGLHVLPQRDEEEFLETSKPSVFARPFIYSYTLTLRQWASADSQQPRDSSTPVPRLCHR